MASYKGHLVFSFLIVFGFIFLISNYLYQPSTKDIILYIVIGLLFALWPDIDIKSLGQRLFYSLFFVTDVFLILNRDYRTAAYFGLLIILPVMAKHRGWTHSKTAMLVIPLPILIYPIWVTRSLDFSNLPFYCAAVIGYFSHILLDGRFMK